MITDDTAATATDPGATGGASAELGHAVLRYKILGIVKSMVFFTSMLILLRTFAVQGFVIRSDSMNQTLLADEFIIVNRAAFGTHIPFLNISTAGYSEPRRFDVVVFRRSTQSGGAISYAKRIVGLPGDTLMMRDQTLYTNGERADEPYVTSEDRGDAAGPEMAWQIPHLTETVDPSTYFPSRDNWDPLVVPTQQFFVLGDNRDSSIDSRHYGFVREHELVGRASHVSFSYDHDSERQLRIIRSIRWGRLGMDIN